MNISAIVFSCSAIFAATANAQVGNYTWQVSTDNGSSWGSLAVASPGSAIKVRLLASWSDITGTSLGYAGGQFDGLLTGATMLDSVSNIRKFVPPIFEEPPIVATAFTGGLKLDLNSDTSLPGQGAGWINPGQAAADFAAPGTYISSNPAVVFSYDFLWNSGSTVDVGMVSNTVAGRAMAIYISSSGSQYRLSSTSVTISTATVTVPSPGGYVVLAMCACAARRRRGAFPST